MEYLNFTDFAKEAGITRQTLYNHIEKNVNNISSYVTVIDGHKMLDSKAISLYKNDYQSNSSISNEKELTGLYNQIDTLQSVNSILQSEIKEKNELISNLTTLLDQEQKLNLTSQKRVAELETEINEKENKKWWKFWK